VIIPTTCVSSTTGSFLILLEFIKSAAFQKLESEGMVINGEDITLLTGSFFCSKKCYEDNFCNVEVYQNDELNLKIIGKDQIVFLPYQGRFPHFRHECVLFESQ